MPECSLPAWKVPSARAGARRSQGVQCTRALSTSSSEEEDNDDDNDDEDDDLFGPSSPDDEESSEDDDEATDAIGNGPQKWKSRAREMPTTAR